MDLTSYLIGRNSAGGSGGGNTGTSVVFVNENNGTLDIKPSDIIDTNGKLQNKYYILKYEDDEYKNFFPVFMIEVYGDDIYIAFGDSQNYSEYGFLSSISSDSYFTIINNSVPTPNPLI